MGLEVNLQVRSHTAASCSCEFRACECGLPARIM